MNMSDSDDNKNSLNQIFMTTTFRTSKGTTNIIPNTSQNLYLNEISRTAKAKISKSKQIGGKNKDDQKNVDESETLSESDTDSDNVSDSSTEEQEDIDPNEEPVDEYDEESETEEIVEAKEDLNEKETDKETEIIKETEYNEDESNEKFTEAKDGEDDGNDECLYQYDDLVEERDTERQSYEIPKNERITDPQLTHYEKVRVLGIRTKQIEMGSKVMAKLDKNINMSANDLAKCELKYKTSPLKIKRSLPDNSYEIWKISEMNINDNEIDKIIDELHESFDKQKKLFL